MLSRRTFLQGRTITGAEAVLRPPWAMPESVFRSTCTRCDACIQVCPTHILARGEGGFPIVDFSSSECTFCGDCLTACRTGALKRDAASLPWTLRASMSEGCLAKRNVECRVCGETCGAGAIRFRPRRGGVALPELNEAACTGCGACVAPCPVQAIAMSQELESNP